MSAPRIPPRLVRVAQSETPAHLYAIGQPVRLKTTVSNGAPAAGLFHVTATLPPRGASPQYRIRSASERHDRMATQDDLEAAASAAGPSARLADRTFGHG